MHTLDLGPCLTSGTSPYLITQDHSGILVKECGLAGQETGSWASMGREEEVEEMPGRG